MREDVEKALADIEISNKRFRRHLRISILKCGIVFFTLVSLAIIVFVFAPSTSSGVFTIMAIVGSMPCLFFFAGLYSYIQPDLLEETVYRKITDAIRILEKSRDPMACEEANICLKKALRLLRKRELSKLTWYNGTNKIITQFLDNFELVVLPMSLAAKIKQEHLEDIGLAVFYQEPVRLETTNKSLEEEPSYKRNERSPPKQKPIFTTLSESQIVRVIVSLVLGYGLIFAICIVFAIVTQQDIIGFMKGHPEIVILGGLGAAGITFWKTKPPS